MSGPALRHWDSHSSIHESALGEATELTELFRLCIENEDFKKALEIAYITVEHWETRTLQHASSEEEGLYKEITETTPEAKEIIIALTRDHTLMRYLVREVKEIVSNQGSFEEILKRFQALILIDTLHNEDEGILLGEETVSHESTA
ncbi:hypothetical protein [Brevibacillus daliensis]|uniref:hypothetical protein n=1 Tax=Brevibacillus daliensis TaxID=2892995 RepID=UPI001E611494|nr:hypothetical protein [Brevibacillus daliensis]